MVLLLKCFYLLKNGFVPEFMFLQCPSIIDSPVTPEALAGSRKAERGVAKKVFRAQSNFLSPN
jgi:hypothetical protein